MGKPIRRLLYIDENPERILIRDFVLRTHGYRLDIESPADGMVYALTSEPFAAVVVAGDVTSIPAPRLIAEIKRGRPMVPVVLVDETAQTVPSNCAADRSLVGNSARPLELVATLSRMTRDRAPRRRPAMPFSFNHAQGA